MENGLIRVPSGTTVQISNQLVTTRECASSTRHCRVASKRPTQFCFIWLTAGGVLIIILLVRNSTSF